MYGRVSECVGERVRTNNGVVNPLPESLFKILHDLHGCPTVSIWYLTPKTQTFPENLCPRVSLRTVSIFFSESGDWGSSRLKRRSFTKILRVERPILSITRVPYCRDVYRRRGPETLTRRTGDTSVPKERGEMVEVWFPELEPLRHQ